MQLGGFAFEDHWLGAARLEDLLVALGERAQGYVRQLRAYLELFEDRGDRRELALTAVEQDQVRSLGELLVAHFETIESSADHLGHAREVVRALYRSDFEPPVLILGGPSALEHHHRGNRVGPHRVRDVVALYPHR